MVCPRCGNLRSVCSNPEIDWHPHSTVCWPSATAEWGWRRLAEKHGHPSESKASAGLHDLDGLRVFAAPQAPENDEFA